MLFFIVRLMQSLRLQIKRGDDVDRWSPQHCAIDLSEVIADNAFLTDSQNLPTTYSMWCSIQPVSLRVSQGQWRRLFLTVGRSLSALLVEYTPSSPRTCPASFSWVA